MEKEIRSLLASTTLGVRRLLEAEFSKQLEGTFDVFESGEIGAKPSDVLTAEQAFVRSKIVASIQHRRQRGESPSESVKGYVRECAFTLLNRLAALKMMEARQLVKECVSRGADSAGFKEFVGLAPGLALLPDKGYRLYLECVWDEVGREVGVLFNRCDSGSLLWPARRALEDTLALINTAELSRVWREDETIGWIYQYYNDPEERTAMRDPKRGGSAAPRNSRELAVRNQFFTPRYVVEFLTDNTLGRLWYEMTKGKTQLASRCRYLIQRPNEVFLGNPAVIGCLDSAAEWVREVVLTANFSSLPENPPVSELSDLGLAIDGYGELKRRGRDFEAFVADYYRPQLESPAAWTGDAFELWCALFIYQRDALRHGCFGRADNASDDALLRRLWPALRNALMNPPAVMSQEESFRHPVFIPHRPIKDPREIRIIDPACGSMHFGLYAFDLLTVIYAEGFAAHAELGTECLNGASGSVLTEVTRNEREFLAEVPRLIIERNIHGVDIDPRAAQIAGLALWLRAQRDWQSMGLPAGGRPMIRRSNIVCAEPMPGDEESLNEFCVSLQQPAIAGMVRLICEKMKLAGEAGSLLKIEEEIRDLVHSTKLKWGESYGFEKGQEELFSKAEIVGRARIEDGQEKLPIDFSGVTDESFWERAEEHIYAALRAYSESAESSQTFKRRLFVEDAAQGFAFIDLCRQRYDVALMNPPFGDASIPSKPYIEDAYGDTKGDVYKAFVECFYGRLTPAGYLGIISSRTGFFLGQSEDWRTRVVLRLFRPMALADLGMGVLDAMVEVAAYVLRSLSSQEARDLTRSIVPALKEVDRNSQGRFSLAKWQTARRLKRHQALAELEHLQNHGFVQKVSGDVVRYTSNLTGGATLGGGVVFPPLVCLRALSDEDKAAAVAEALANSRSGRRFIVNPSLFLRMPCAPFAYWAGAAFQKAFDTLPPLGSLYVAASGTGTLDDFRFLRLWIEAPQNKESRGAWFPYAKGGSFSRFYYDQALSVKWLEDGAEMKAWIILRYGGGHWTRNIRSTEHYFRPGITWPRRSQRGLSIRAMPAGCIFGDKGPAVFHEKDDPTALLAILAITNSAAFRELLSLQVSFGSYEVGAVQRTVVPSLSEATASRLAVLARRAWVSKWSVDSTSSISHAFTLPALLVSSGTTLLVRAARWSRFLRECDETISTIQDEIDASAFDLYGLPEADRNALTVSLDAATSDTEEEVREDEEEDTAFDDAAALVADLIGYSLGVAFGLWDVRYATGVQSVPEPPDPFALLPLCPPGQLQNARGLPAQSADVPAIYPVRILWEGFVVDAPNHSHDIEGCVRGVLEVIWKKSEGVAAEAIEQEACEILRANSLREYLRKPGGFFAHHLKRYSKSRRQAPIYWQLSSPGGLCSVWLYYHRTNADTLFSILRDFVQPKLENEERHWFNLKQQVGPSPSPSQAREISEAAELVEDLRAFRDEVQRVAPLWNPNLNDGVVINHAPLWRITPFAPWRKTLKETWDAIVRGDYDWAHMAIHLWPERVIPKCTTDRSLAIAHGLEALFWEQDSETEKWSPRKRTKAEIERLVAERTSPAVKASLESLLSAPAPSGGATKRHKKAKQS